VSIRHESLCHFGASPNQYRKANNLKWSRHIGATQWRNAPAMKSLHRPRRVIRLVAFVMTASSPLWAQSNTPSPPARSATPAPPSAGAATANAPPAPLLPGEQEALKECKKYPPNKRFKWELRGEVDLMSLLNSMAPMLCRPIIVPGSVRQSKVTIIAPDTLTAPEVYRMFLSSLETMGLTVQPEGKALKIIETNRARESAIPFYTDSEHPPTQDQYVTRLLHLEHVSPDDVKAVLDRLKGRDGDITAYAPTNTLVITDLASNIKRMEQVVTQLDVPMGGEKLWVIKLHTVAATDMATMLSTVFNVQKGGGQTKGTRPPNLGSGPPAPAAAGAAPDKGPPGADLSVTQIIPDDRLNMLVIVATETAYRRILALVKRLDQQLLRGESAGDLVHVIALENANADDVAGTLAGLGAAVSRNSSSSSATGAGTAGRPSAPPSSPSTPGQPAQRGLLFEGDVRISSDRPTNSLVVLASERDFLTVRDLIKKLDIPRRQVFVEATILEISVDSTRNLGVAYHGGSTVNGSLVYGASEPSSTVNSLSFNTSALQGLAAGIVGSSIPGAATILGLAPGTSVPSFGVFLQLLETSGNVNVISMPHLLTTDNEKATISVGQNLPFPGAIGGFTGLSGSQTGSSVGLGTSVQRQDVALKLEITPHVNDSDLVRLEIDNEISDVANPNYNGLGPATTKRTVKSVVTVRDQQSIVLGGLIKDSVSKTVNKIPLLGDIPVIGFLFRSTTDTITKQNLLIVLTPYIIKDPVDLRRVFERKIRERQEFMDRYTAFHNESDFEAQVDYRRKRGLLEEINRTATEAEQEAASLRAAESALNRSDITGAVDLDPTPASAPLPRR
jgi:general secretion pathway protein D